MHHHQKMVVVLILLMGVSTISANFSPVKTPDTESRMSKSFPANEELGLEITRFSQLLFQQVQKRIASSHDIHSLKDELVDNCKTIETFRTSFAEETNAKEFLRNLKKLCLDLDLPLDVMAVTVEKIRNSTKIVDVLEETNKQIFQRKYWMPYVKQALDRFSFQRDWYVKLVELYEFLSSYDVQKNREMYGVAKLEDWGFRGKPRGLQVNPSNFPLFIKKLQTSFRLPGLESLPNLGADETNFRHLNLMLNLTLNQDPEGSCTEEGKILMGHVVFLKEIHSVNCPRDLILVYATKVIYLDTDLVYNNVTQIGLFAPNIELNGDVTITLNGINAAEHTVRKAAPEKDGLAGNPGSHGGLFLAVSNAFSPKRNKLTVTSIGGNGSKGQDGGDGRIGTNGSNAPWVKTKNRCGAFWFKSCCIWMNGANHNVLGPDHYLILGTKGSRGSIAGSGGKPGIKGKRGSVNFISNKLDGAVLVSSDGKDGAPGLGGIGGKGGRNGLNEEKICRKKKWTSASKDGGYQPNGENGSNGASNLPQPTLPLPQNKLTARVVTNYKAYLLKNIPHVFVKRSLKPFLNMLYLNKEINDMYEVKDLVDEVLLKEKFYAEIRNEIDFIDVYQHDLRRIEASSRQVNTLEKKKVLAYLYTAIQGRKASLTQSKDDNLVTDTRKYLEAAIENIKRMEEFQVQQLRMNYTVDYKYTIDAKIEEATALTRVLNAAIEKNAKILSETTNGLIGEIENLQHQAEQQLNDMHEALARLNRNMGLKMSLGIIGGIFSIFGSGFPIAGAIGKTLGGISSSLSLSGDTSPPMVLPDGIDRLNEAKSILEKFCYRKLEALREQLDMIAEDAVNQQDEIVAFQKEIDAKLKQPPNYQIVVDMKQKVRTFLEGLQSTRSSKKYLRLLKLPLDIYLEYRNEKKKLDITLEAIEENISKLQAFEDNIFGTLIPMLAMMMDDLQEAMSQAGQQSSTKLDVTAWQIDRVIKEVRFHLEDFTQGFESQREFDYGLEELSDAMVTFLDIYQNIQGYQEQKILADYIANIASPSSDGIEIQDKELASGLRLLESTIRSNEVVAQYERATKAFKQLVFPFVHSYLFNVPDSLPSGDLIHVSTSKIEALADMLSGYDYQPVPHDEYLITGIFCSKCGSGVPFFVWGKHEFKTEIDDLLKGKTVYLPAHPQGSKNGVKFQSLELVLSAKDRAEQRKLNRILKQYRVELIHTGNSYYKCDRDMYVIPGKSQVLMMSFEKKADGEPMEANEVYRKIRRGDVMLSPYVLWKVRLIDQTRGGYKPLERFIGKVDLSLEGKGRYVWRESKVCEKPLEDYYTKVFLGNNVF